MTSLEDKVSLAVRSNNSLDLLKEEVLQRLAEYENAETVEEKAVRETYEAIANGNKLVSLGDVLSTYYDRKIYPSFAVAPAGVTELFVATRHGETTGKRSVTFFSDLPGKFRKWSVQVPVGGIDWRVVPRGHSFKGKTSVPPIPPRIKKEYDLKDRLVMFEPQWTTIEETTPRVRDPLLLRHLHGDIYVVEAAWELTDLEVAVISGVNRKKI